MNIKVDPEVHKVLMIRKLKTAKKNVNEVLRELLKL